MDSPAPPCAHWKKSHCLPFWKLQVKKFRPLLGPSFRTVLIKQRFPWRQKGKCKSAHCDREKQQPITLVKLLFRTRGLDAKRVMTLVEMLHRLFSNMLVYLPQRSCICSLWEGSRRRTAVLYSRPACEPLWGLLDDDGMYSTAHWRHGSPFVVNWQSERSGLQRCHINSY